MAFELGKYYKMRFIRSLEGYDKFHYEQKDNHEILFKYDYLKDNQVFYFKISARSKKIIEYSDGTVKTKDYVYHTTPDTINEGYICLDFSLVGDSTDMICIDDCGAIQCKECHYVRVQITEVSEEEFKLNKVD